MLYSGFKILPRSVVRRQTGFAARITRTLSAFEKPMARIWQFTLTKMFIATAIFAVAVVLYTSNRTVVSTQLTAVGFFGPGPLDYAGAHKELLLDIDPTKYVAIEEPEWAANRRASGSKSYTAGRSDWFEIEKNGAKNYVHISSSEMGFAVDVWIYKRRMNHQTAYRENLLSNEVVPEFAEWWDNWLDGNRNKFKNGG